MKIVFYLVVLSFLLCVPAMAQEQGFQDELIDKMAGNWVMKGMIAGGEVTHDITAEWVLSHQYLSFHEVSREKEENGELAYEAIVFVGWDEPSGQYACLWLDSTGGGGLGAQAIGHAKPDGDVLAFLFNTGDGGFFHTTFVYNRDGDTWDWLMDMESEGKRLPFARVSLTRQ